MTARVIVSPEAFVQIDAIDDWWRANRPAARDLFASELAAALDAVASAPRIGHSVEHADVSGLRRVLLRSTRFHVYYVPADDVVRIVAAWSSVRGRGPDLTRF